MRGVAMSLTCAIHAEVEHPAYSATIVEQFLHAWLVYSYVCPRAACVLRSMELKPGHSHVCGIGAFAERESDYRVQGINLFAQAVLPYEPHVMLAFGELVRQCLSGIESALERMPVLKSVVSSYIHMHDCSPLFCDFLPQEALRSAASSMRVQPVADETLLYSRSGGLEETILKVSAFFSSSHAFYFTLQTAQTWFKQQIIEARGHHSLPAAARAISSSAQRAHYLLDNFAHPSTLPKLHAMLTVDLVSTLNAHQSAVRFAVFLCLT
jgi:hypothetical protein